MPVSARNGDQIQLLVENQGRSYKTLDSRSLFKGILGDVTYSGNVLTNWTMTGYPFESYGHIISLLSKIDNALNQKTNAEYLCGGPTVFHATFRIFSGTEIWDTYLNPSGWGKVCMKMTANNINKCK